MNIIHKNNTDGYYTDELIVPIDGQSNDVGKK